MQKAEWIRKSGNKNGQEKWFCYMYIYKFIYTYTCILTQAIKNTQNNVQLNNDSSMKKVP